MNTNFFSQATALMPNFDLQFGITKKEELFAVIVTLRPLGGSEEQAKSIGPIVFDNATAEELDELFFDKIKEPLEKAAALFSDNTEEFKNKVEKAAVKPTKKPTGKTATKEVKQEEAEDTQTDEEVHESLNEEPEETAKPKSKSVASKPEKKETPKPVLDEPVKLNSDGHLNKGNTLYAKKEFEEALKHYTSAYELTKDKKTKELIQESINSCKVKIKAKQELFGKEEEKEEVEDNSAEKEEAEDPEAEENENDDFDPNDL